VADHVPQIKKDIPVKDIVGQAFEDVVRMIILFL
jgi:hypothetical protein